MAENKDKNQTEKSLEEKEMPFLDHLEELRWRILKSLAAILIFAIASFYFSTQFLNFLTQPINNLDPVPEIIFLTPTGMFMVRITLSLVAGVILGFPVIFYQIWRFVMPGLYRQERQYVIPVLIACTGFFLIGAVMAYFVVIPLALRFLMAMATETIKPTLEIGKYVGFITRLILAFGIVFQLPIISFFLASIGLITPASMRRFRRYAVIGTFALAAVITPPDVYSQILLAFPLLGLYELSILITTIAFRGRDKEEPEEEETEERPVIEGQDDGPKTGDQPGIDGPVGDDEPEEMPED
jgi:sec-independent protein translocase protein TatC